MADNLDDVSPDRASDEASGVSRRSLLGGLGGLAAAVAAAGVVGGAGGVAADLVDAPAANAAPLDGQAGDPHEDTGRDDNAPIVGVTNPRIRIIPLDKAKFRVGAFFDMRVEAASVNPVNAQIAVSVQGPNGLVNILNVTPERTNSVTGSLELTWRHVTYADPGQYLVTATVTNGAETFSGSIVHNVVGAGAGGAKNVIFFLGDGMGGAAITGARLISKGIKEGKYNGALEMDQMPNRGIVGTSGADSIATDSANSMSAYMTGHKSSVNAMGVYESNATSNSAHPKVETMAEFVKRRRGMAVGIVTTAEIQDATPAAVFAHTRRRSEYIAIMDQSLTDAQRPDVFLGGGLASLLPQTTPGSRRKDNRNLVDEFRALGYAYAQDRPSLQTAMASKPSKLLGTFQMGNMNVYVDRQLNPNPSVLGSWSSQPTLMEMTQAALDTLSAAPNGFFLMVEGASIDKQEHPQDGTRAVYDTIEMDKAIGIAKRFAAQRGDTLVVVTADHNHSMSIVGTHTTATAGRDGNGIYGKAGFPTYVDNNGDGFPTDPNPSVHLFFGWSNHPDHTDAFNHEPVPTDAAVYSATAGAAIPNPAHDPNAQLQSGNLPVKETHCVHTVDDVSIVASGPGANRVQGFMDNTEVFHVMIDALGI